MLLVDLEFLQALDGFFQRHVHFHIGLNGAKRLAFQIRLAPVPELRAKEARVQHGRRVAVTHLASMADSAVDAGPSSPVPGCGRSRS